MLIYAPTLQFIRADKLGALAITSSTRSPLLPDVPTVAESGVQGFEFTQCFGIVGPTNLPTPIVQRLNIEINAILKTAEVPKKLADLGADPIGGTPEEFADVIRKDFPHDNGD